jgi:hypothetical protein
VRERHARVIEWPCALPRWVAAQGEPTIDPHDIDAASLFSKTLAPRAAGHSAGSDRKGWQSSFHVRASAPAGPSSRSKAA